MMGHQQCFCVVCEDTRFAVAQASALRARIADLEAELTQWKACAIEREKLIVKVLETFTGAGWKYMSEPRK